MDLYHLTLSTLHRQPLARCESVRCGVLRRLARVCGSELVLFCLVDDHLHAVVACDRVRAGRLASNLSRSLAQYTSVQLDRMHTRPVDSRRHLETLVRYLLNQSQRHGLSVHPAVWPGSCFSDLVGARVLSGFASARLFDWLPRRNIRWVAEQVGLGVPRPVEMERLEELSVQRIARVACITLCTDGLGRGHPAYAARAAAVRLSAASGRRPADIGRSLGLSVRSVQRLLLRPQPRVELAVRTHLAIEEMVATKGRR